MKNAIFSLVLFAGLAAALPAHAEITADDLAYVPTSHLQAKVRSIQMQHVFSCPVGIVGAVLTAGAQIVPVVSVINPIIGRSQDWKSADWSLNSSYEGDSTTEVYVSSAGGILTPVYDTVAGTISTFESFFTTGRFKNGYSYRATKSFWRILSVQESRMLGQRSKCMTSLRELVVIRQEIRRRAALRH